MSDLQRFIDGFCRFQQHFFEETPELFEQLRGGQRPGTLLIGCCDSRVDPALLLGVDPGDIFTIRNIGNLVPPCVAGTRHQGVSAAIQFAVQQLEVERIIVLGHAQCGGIRALLENRYSINGELDFIGRWMNIAASARDNVMSTLADATPAERQRACEQASILVSLKNLQSFPWVAERVEKGLLTLHGWYFDLEAGALLAYAPRSDSFLPVVCPLGVGPKRKPA
ncbi:carbonic anhydrase [Chitinivorax sp. PXF-14]|uniref:carbonic anhydrase n=1 Tax=Chitinivorax sp. PXF-14 TaxID=3230488 RepID=UPI003467B368